MGVLMDRANVVGNYLVELIRQGLPIFHGPLDREVVFILDGVGGFQFVPVLARKVIRELGAKIGTVLYKWQFGLPGEIFTDLCWHSRNRRKGAELADKIVAFHKEHPHAKIHVLAFSGGAGPAVFACERLAGRATIETLLLACPALSPEYNLGPALAAVRRCYALISDRDTFLLGIGTRVFGTTDRVRCNAAGQVGFRAPAGISAGDHEAYEKLRQITWIPELRQQGHRGGHTGWANVNFLRRNLLPLLHGEPLLPQAPAIRRGIQQSDCAAVT